MLNIVHTTHFTSLICHVNLLCFQVKPDFQRLMWAGLYFKAHVLIGWSKVGVTQSQEEVENQRIRKDVL